MSDTTLDKLQPTVLPVAPSTGGGSPLSPAESAVLKEQLHAMWKYELVHLYAHTMELSCNEKDLTKQHRILQRAELMSDEILIRMKR